MAFVLVVNKDAISYFGRSSHMVFQGKRSLFGLLLVVMFCMPSLANLLSNNVFMYIGQPNSGQVWLMLGGYRHYSPQKGIFLKQDSYSPFVNRYTPNGFNYGLGNPNQYIDPSGHVISDIKFLRRLWVLQGLRDGRANNGMQGYYIREITSRVIARGQKKYAAPALGDSLLPPIVEHAEYIPLSLIYNQHDPLTGKALRVGDQVFLHYDMRTDKIHAMRVTLETKKLLRSQKRCLLCGEGLAEPPDIVEITEEVLTG